MEGGLIVTTQRGRERGRGRPPIPVEEKIRRLEEQKRQLEEQQRQEVLARWQNWTREQLGEIEVKPAPLQGPLGLGVGDDLLSACSPEFRELWDEWARTVGRVHVLARELQHDRGVLGREFPQIRGHVITELSSLAQEWRKRLQAGLKQETERISAEIIAKIEEKLSEIPEEQRVLWLALERLRIDTQRSELVHREFASPGEAWATLQLRNALRAEVLPQITESSTAASSAVVYLVGEEKLDIIRKLQRIHDSLGEPTRLHALLDPIRKI